MYYGSIRKKIYRMEKYTIETQIQTKTQTNIVLTNEKKPNESNENPNEKYDIINNLNNFMHYNNINTIDVLEIIKEKYLQLQNIKIPRLKNNNYKFFIERFIKILQYNSLDKNTHHIKTIKVSQILQQIVKVHINKKNNIPFYLIYFTLKDFYTFIIFKYKFKNTKCTLKDITPEKYKIIKSFSNILIYFLNLIFRNEYLSNIKVFQIICNEDYDTILNVLNIELYNKFKNEYTYNINESNLSKKSSDKKYFCVHYHGYKYFINILNDESTCICMHKFHLLLKFMLQSTNLMHIIKNISINNLNFIYYLLTKNFMIKSSEYIFTLLNKIKLDSTNTVNYKPSNNCNKKNQNKKNKKSNLNYNINNNESNK